jgi:hypothetical protein
MLMITSLTHHLLVQIRLDIMFIDNKQDIPNLKKRLKKIEVS